MRELHWCAKRRGPYRHPAIEVLSGQPKGSKSALLLLVGCRNASLGDSRAFIPHDHIDLGASLRQRKPSVSSLESYAYS